MSTNIEASTTKDTRRDERLAILLAMAMFVLVIDTSMMNVSISWFAKMFNGAINEFKPSPVNSYSTWKLKISVAIGVQMIDAKNGPMTSMAFLTIFGTWTFGVKKDWAIFVPKSFCFQLMALMAVKPAN